MSSPNPSRAGGTGRVARRWYRRTMHSLQRPNPPLGTFPDTDLNRLAGALSTPCLTRRQTNTQSAESPCRTSPSATGPIFCERRDAHASNGHCVTGKTNSKGTGPTHVRKAHALSPGPCTLNRPTDDTLSQKGPHIADVFHRLPLPQGTKESDLSAHDPVLKQTNVINEIHQINPPRTVADAPSLSPTAGTEEVFLRFSGQMYYQRYI